MQDMIAINILIGDRSYRIKVNPQDEQEVRKAVKLINDKVLEYKHEFAGKDMQDYIAMVLLWYATQRIDDTNNHKQSPELENKLHDMENTLDKILNK